MSENEIKLIQKVVNCILKYCGRRPVSYGFISKNTEIPINIIKIIAIQVCKSLLTIPIVDDVDICDGDSFDVMLKRKIA
jgi:hypothetical protein